MRLIVRRVTSRLRRDPALVACVAPDGVSLLVVGLLRGRGLGRAEALAELRTSPTRHALHIGSVWGDP